MLPNVEELVRSGADNPDMASALKIRSLKPWLYVHADVDALVTDCAKQSHSSSTESAACGAISLNLSANSFYFIAVSLSRASTVLNSFATLSLCLFGILSITFLVK